MITLHWCPRQLYTGVAPIGCGGSTLVMLAFIYVVTAVVRMYERKIVTSKRLLVVMILFLAITGLFSAGIRIPMSKHPFNDYNSPLAWMMGCAIVVYFIKYVKFPAWVSRSSAFLAPSMFGVYLLHNVAIGYENYAHWQQLTCRSLGGAPGPIVVILFAVMVFVGCLVFDLICRVAVELLVRFSRRMK